MPLEEQRENQIREPRENYLPRRAAERINRRGLPLLREHRTERPTERSELQPERPPKFAVSQGIGMPKIRPNEHDHPGDPDRQPNLAAPRDVMVAQQQAIEHQKPERRNRNQQRRETSGNDLLRIRKRKITPHQKQNADRREMPKLAGRKTNAASSQRTVSEHHRARDQEARCTHDARRNLLNRDANAQISR